MPRVLYRFDTETWVKSLDFLCCLKGNDAFIRDDQQDRDINGAHQV